MQVQLSTQTTPIVGNSSFTPLSTLEKTYSLARKIIEGIALIFANLFSFGAINLIGRARLEFRRVFFNDTIIVQKKNYPGLKELRFLSRSQSHIVDINKKNSLGINNIAKNSRAYGYCSEGVNDSKWGCAWRTIQTVMSSFGEVPSFFDLYTRYGSREFLEKQFKDSYPERHKAFPQWKAPHELTNGWAEPFVGHMILKSLGRPSTLLAVNGMPHYCCSPRIFDRQVRFNEFFQLLEDHFKKNDAAPVMIDNGISAMNIIGAGRQDENFNLLIADPHTNPNPDVDNRGIYLIKLGKTGNQIARLYPAAISHTSPWTCKGLSFSLEKRWMVLFPGPDRSTL